MGTYLSGVFNFGLQGKRDSEMTQHWLEELKKINLPYAKYLNEKNELVTETGEWEIEISGFGGDDPSEFDEPEMPYTITFSGPFMFHINLKDNNSTIETYHKLKLIIEQYEWFDSFIASIHEVLRVFNATELIWLSPDGPTQYASIYQSEVWSDTPYEMIKEILANQFGEFVTSYQDFKEQFCTSGWGYDDLNKAMLDSI